MHKRLFGILASVAVIVAACGGATTSRRRRRPAIGRGSGRIAAAAVRRRAAPSGADLADEQILTHRPRRRGPDDPRPEQGARARTRSRCFTRLHRGLLYFDKDLKVVSRRWPRRCRRSRPTAKTLTFKLRDAKYSNGDPIVAGDLVYAWKRLIDPRTAATTYYDASWPRSPARQDLLDLYGRRAGRRPTPKIDAAAGQARRHRAGRQDLRRQPRRPRRPTSRTSSPCGSPSPIQEKWITSPNATEAANYVSSGPFMLEPGTTTAEIVLKPNPNWYGAASRP